jgi:hypothetical protein
MRYAILAIALVMAVPASAEGEKIGFGRTVVAPPIQWQFEPIDPVYVYYLPQKEIIERCSKAAGKYEDIGCASPASPEFPQCLILIAEEAYDDFKQRVLVHEKAHCNGWPAYHPED